MKYKKMLIKYFTEILQLKIAFQGLFIKLLQMS